MLLERLAELIMHLRIARQRAAGRLERRQRVLALVLPQQGPCACRIRQRPFRGGPVGRSFAAAVLVLAAAAAGTGLVASGEHLGFWPRGSGLAAIAHECVAERYAQRAKPGLKVAPLIEALAEDGPAHLLRARGTDAAFGAVEFDAGRFEGQIAEVEDESDTALEVVDHVLVMDTQHPVRSAASQCSISSR